MNSKDIITLGLGLQAPWEITGQLLDTDKKPHELRLTIQAQRGTCYPCPICGALCHAHDFKEMTWRHLIFKELPTNSADEAFFAQLHAGDAAAHRSPDHVNRGPALGKGPVGHQVEGKVNHFSSDESGCAPPPRRG